ncbi:dihydrodipicolinate synthase family protein [Lignipirellula cremea]|uniref:Putative 2-keto-3-deoxy-galactonate aldolase YagE n=1 Tax=Lignipirellula cremea TaxID=2528010 RepID=A0A518E351_9BACT|nr:dihydrodipicolinate synthase family protein [Lignipirellula cremea]QDU98492.1 putative 2-keto-3-deoxy-galactonate aldolase YagE [Lignipirellula cremea]
MAPVPARPFSGVIPPLATPLTDRDTLDQPGLERLVEHVLAGGVSGLFILGTTGEAPSLGYRLRGELIERVCRLVDGRVPVLVGVTDTAFVESVAIARKAADAGATAVVLTTPYYFPAGQTELLAYIRNLLAELPLPVMLYNIPVFTKVVIEIDTLRQLADDARILGMKDSGGDLDYFDQLLQLRDKHRPDWSVLMGPEALLGEAVRRGGDGGVAGGANIMPQLFVDWYTAAVSGDDARFEQIQQRIFKLQEIYSIGKYASRHIKATKCALSLLGLCDDFMAEPFHRFRPPHRKQVQEILDACQA